MKKPFTKNSNIHNPYFKQQQSGMTLLEVLVSMFVLAIGVLALLATQLRTVSSVREAESQTIVAQAVQNLIEGMMINPTLSAETRKTDAGGTEETGWIKKRYDDNSKTDIKGIHLSYRYASPQTAKSCAQSKWCKTRDDKGKTILPSSSLTKGELLRDQLGIFADTLVKALPDADIQYLICNDSSGKEITVNNGAINHNCTGAEGEPLVIKVVWQIDIEKEIEKDTNKSALNQSGTKVIYTYQARLGE